MIVPASQYEIMVGAMKLVLAKTRSKIVITIEIYHTTRNIVLLRGTLGDVFCIRRSCRRLQPNTQKKRTSSSISKQ